MRSFIWCRSTRNGGTAVRAAVIAAFCVALVAGQGTLAAACPACSPGDDETRGVYVATTVILSALPLVMIVLGGLLLRRALGGREAAMRPPSPHRHL